ncbi:hypothetical protein [Brachybacterium sacelli]|uniref:Uncharacterized protein n=1 Tax=Brachybacterium sacelli TaxID=173364 RepID=A0ABS4X6N0_9MICO|nr:hypothetical protein [Brachybacterium sacelli]MBP2384118.1 hypothetical protein [Brachybacterium sacelli]
MSENSPRERSSHEPDPATQEQWQRAREEVLSEYGTWRVTADEDAPVAEEVRTLETLLRLKTEQQGSPEPGLWTEELATELLTEIVPRTVIQPREHVMDMVPTLGHFFTYLGQTGRWAADSMPPQAAPMMLASLEFATLEAADDPSRRSFSTNILGHGLALGVDLEDDEELAGYMHWYNSLPDDERVELSDTGRLTAPTVPFDREESIRAAQDESRLSSSWPWFLPELEDGDGVTVTELETDQEAEAYADNTFVRIAVGILDLVGDGSRRITGTQALTRADSSSLLATIGTPQSVRTMWQHAELSGPWVTLLDGGWLSLSGSQVHRETGPVRYVPLSEDPEKFVEFGHAVLTATLFGRDARDREDGGFRGMPDTLAALLVACSEQGLDLRENLDGASGEAGAAGARAQTAVQRSVEDWQRFSSVRADLDDLARAGVLTRDGERYRGSSAVMGALVALIKDQNTRGDGTA